MYVNGLNLPKRLPVLGVRMSHFDLQLDRLWYLSNHAHWYIYVDMEVPIGTENSCEDMPGRLFFVG